MRIVVWHDLTDTERIAILRRPGSQSAPAAIDSVREIMADVKSRGEMAVRDWTRKFDGFDPVPLFVPEQEIATAGEKIDAALRAAITLAHGNIKRFHARQGCVPYTVETMPGLVCARHLVPIQRVGLYVPGGTAPLLSTVLMLGIPSQIAQCPERILCTPGDRNGVIHPAILYAAHLCGIDRIVRVGGAQAIAGLAHGLFGAPVDKIFGPGNAYVTLAKQQAAQEAGGPAIDMPAGPSEVLVIVDSATPDAFAAADLLAQAEHDATAQVVLIAPSHEKAESIIHEAERQTATLPRANIIRAALANSFALVIPVLEDALHVSNLYAPEHLILCFDEAERVKPLITNAGSVFCGLHTPESLGDYASGTNHVLPTAGAARAYSGASVESFQKTITWQSATRSALAAIGPAVQAMAMAETLDAHARAVAVRLEHAA